MISRAARIARTFLATPRKAAWIEDRLAWKIFQLRQVRQDRINCAFDQTHGTDTAGELALVDAGVSLQDARQGNIVYRPLWERHFHRTMRAFQKKLGQRFDEFSFVDIGSGKGKLLLLASLYPFRQVRGIEFAPRLHAIARENVRRFADPERRCHDVQPLLGDALTFTLPPGPVIALIFNAFDQQTMARVIANLMIQRQEAGAPCFVIYENVRRAAEIGTAMAVPAPWRTLDRTRTRIIVGNPAAAALWATTSRTGRFSAPRAAETPSNIGAASGATRGLSP